jgi:hypothetical protein
LFIKNIPLFFSIFGIVLAIILNLVIESYKNISNNNKNYLIISVNYPQYFINFIRFFFHK